MAWFHLKLCGGHKLNFIDGTKNLLIFLVRHLTWYLALSLYVWISICTHHYINCTRKHTHTYNPIVYSDLLSLCFFVSFSHSKLIVILCTTEKIRMVKHFWHYVLYIVHKKLFFCSYFNKSFPVQANKSQNTRPELWTIGYWMVQTVVNMHWIDNSK